MLVFVSECQNTIYMWVPASNELKFVIKLRKGFPSHLLLCKDIVAYIQHKIERKLRQALCLFHALVTKVQTEYTFLIRDNMRKFYGKRGKGWAESSLQYLQQSFLRTSYNFHW
jgi:hypothetical protein